MDIFKEICNWLWNYYALILPYTAWCNTSDIIAVSYLRFCELQNAFKIALAFLILRFILMRYVFSPIGCYFGLKPKPTKKVNDDVTESNVLEKAFCKGGKIGHKQIQGLAKQLDWSERRVERWIRRRISRHKPSTLSKFTESAWRFTFYFCALCYGLYTLWDKPWFWTTSYYWDNYPHHKMTNDVWWYYMIELGFYWSLTISQFTDIKRKDFLQMFVHHIVTIMLLTFSWTSNFFRGGSIVIILHDIADVPLEAAKIVKYLKYHRTADAVFVVFVVTWIISRLGLYPWRVLYTTFYESLLFLPMFPSYYAFIALLFALQILNIVWSWMIVKIALRAMSAKNHEVQDIRSDSDECSSSSSSEK